MQLTAKQVRFAAEYVVDGNATAAAIRAGYNPRSARVTACKLLKANKAVQAAVDAQREAVAAKMEMTRQRVINELLDAIAIAKEKRDPSGMIAGWREIAKMCGLYAPERLRVGVGHGMAEDTTMRRLQAMTDAELAAMIADVPEPA